MCRACTVALSMLLAFAGIAMGETLEEVEKKLAEKMAGYKTLSFKQKTKSEMSAPDMRMQVESESLVKYARRPEKKWVSRTESKMRTVREVKDQPADKQDSKMLAICDGTHNHILSEMPQVTTAMRQKVDPATAPDPFDLKALFALQGKDFDLKLLPDEKVEGVDCYVIESVPKKDREQLAATIARSVSYYDKKTAVAVKSVVYDGEGKITTTSVSTDIKADENIPEDQFAFKAPPGVTVVDMDQSPQPAPAQTSEKSTTSDQPANANASESSKKSDAAKSEPSAKEEKKKEDPAGKAVKGLFKGLGR